MSVHFCITPSFNIFIYQPEILQLESREAFYRIHCIICFSAMSFYFLYFFCIFLRKNNKNKMMQNSLFSYFANTQGFLYFSLLIIFLVFWAFWSLLPWLASIKLKDLLAGQTSDFLLNMSWTFVITHKIMENYCTISKRKIWLYERLHVGILQHHWCRIFYLKTSRGSFLRSCWCIRINHKRWKKSDL